MPKIVEYIFLLLTFVIGITVGLYSATDFTGKITKATEANIAKSVQDIVIEKIQQEYNLEKLEEQEIAKDVFSGENEDAITVSIDEVKLSPNAEMVIKKNFALCGHTSVNRMQIPRELVNYTKEDIAKKYLGWEIEKFTQEELILSKDIEANCEEHYVLKIEDNKLKIFNQLTEDKATYVDEVNIELELLPSLEIAKLKQGVEVYGDEELNNLVENYIS